MANLGSTRWFYYVRHKSDGKRVIGIVDGNGAPLSDSGVTIDYYYNNIPQSIDDDLSTLLPISSLAESGIAKRLASMIKKVQTGAYDREYDREYEAMIRDVINIVSRDTAPNLRLRPFNILINDKNITTAGSKRRE